MKHFLLVLFFTFSAFAQDEKLCNYLKERTFKDHSVSFGVDLDTSLGGTVEKVSTELTKKVEEQCKAGRLSAVKDYDSCSSACATAGSSKYANRGFNAVSEISKSCQRLCKSYQLSAFAFQDGLRSKDDESLQKCSIGVNNDEYGNDKSDLIQKVRNQVKIQKDASKQ